MLRVKIFSYYFWKQLYFTLTTATMACIFTVMNYSSQRMYVQCSSFSHHIRVFLSWQRNKFLSWERHYTSLEELFYVLQIPVQCWEMEKLETGLEPSKGIKVPFGAAAWTLMLYVRLLVQQISLRMWPAYPFTKLAMKSIREIIYIVYDMLAPLENWCLSYSLYKLTNPGCISRDWE